VISYGEVVLRLLIAAGLCGLIGFEREARDQAAGLRTHIILGVGAALFTLISAYGFGEFRGTTNFDPTRIAAQIVSGVGFLGAGAILRYGNDVRGVTTAATLWTVAAIGTAVGAGYLFGAVSATAIVLLALLVLRALRRTIASRLRNSVALMEISFKDGGDDAPRALETLERHGIHVRNMDVEFEGQRARYSISVRIPAQHGVQSTLREISELPGVELLSLNGLHTLE
jgi:putative Mg2+ transporter-C (MgtC) family protein